MMTAEAFFQHVEGGGKVDSTDWMPEEYKKEVTRLMGFQALAEIVGAMMLSQWIPYTPSIVRKMMYAAKSQDEMGHAHILIRACEDLGYTREEIIEGYIERKNKLLNIFHYSFDSYEEMVAAMLLQNTGAIVQFQSLVQGSYLPYQRALRKIMKEESFHYNLAVNMIQQVTTHGTDKQRETVQYAFDIWYPRMLAYFGPSEKGKAPSNALKWRIKVDTNDTIRTRWLDKIVPLVESLGYKIQDPELSKDTKTGTWSYTEPKWEEVKAVINGGGPSSEYWRESVSKSYENYQWIRDLMNKKSKNQTA